ncbi:MAG: P1 family peptidase [Subdoligranulum sp.]|nr:P1 family peptidase [Subdoligranulum sp.]
MATQTSCAAYGIRAGTLPSGPLGKISDVPGVTVGHCTIDTAAHKTGVTVLLPCADNPFTNKLPAASYVLNGFGKTAGLVQIDELGTLETPIALTNTLNVGLVHDAMVEYMLRRCEEDGVSLRSVNPVVAECNDGGLNDIAHRAVRAEHVFAAIDAAAADFALGDVGAGKGMVCHDLKGGIGSASRVVELDGTFYTVGVLVLANHGCLRDLRIGGRVVGGEIAAEIARRAEAGQSGKAPQAQQCGEMLRAGPSVSCNLFSAGPSGGTLPVGQPGVPLSAEPTADLGSCIVILATDLPLSSRQLGRVLRRAPVGLARLGSYIGHGSGEVFLGFSTANRVPHESAHAVLAGTYLHEGKIDAVFRAAAEATEEAVLSAMLCADTVTGFDGSTKHSLREFAGVFCET